MLLKPRTASFTFLLGLLVAIAPLSTDMFVPTMPEIASVFGHTPGKDAVFFAIAASERRR